VFRNNVYDWNFMWCIDWHFVNMKIIGRKCGLDLPLCCNSPLSYINFFTQS
jgi:hypothetical protein